MLLLPIACSLHLVLYLCLLLLPGPVVCSKHVLYNVFVKVQCECYYEESRYTNLYAIILLILRWNSNLYNLLRQPGAGLLKITQTRTKLKVCVTNYITILLLMHCGYICSHLVELVFISSIIVYFIGPKPHV